MDFFATCASGLEPLLAEELDGLDARNVETGDGLVTFSGELREAYRACLWSRLAERIVAVLAKGPVDGADSLQALARTVAWERAIARGVGLEVYTSGSAPRLTRSSFASRKVLEAVTDHLLEAAGAVPPRDATERLRIQIHLIPPAGSDGKDAPGEALIGVDLAGEPLWKRSYERLEKRGLPTLRADVAAAALIVAGWPELLEGAAGTTPRLGVMYSGGATLVGEAAAMARDVAPGLLRARWGFEQWLGHKPGTWSALVTSAQRRRTLARGKPVGFICADSRKGSRDYPRSVLRAMGLDVAPTFVTGHSLATAGAGLDAPSLVVADLSWADPDALGAGLLAEAELATFCCGLPAGERGAVLTPSAQRMTLFGEPREGGLALGRLRVPVAIEPYGDLSLSGTRARVGSAETLVLDPETETFGQRLSERAARETLEAARSDVTCYRLFDRDLADYPVAIDLYQGARPTPGRWLVVSGFEPDGDASDGEAASARRRLLDVLNAAPRVLDVSPQDVEVKLRRRAKGGSQYASGGRGPARSRRKPRIIQGAELPFGSALVEEGGLLFEVDLGSHLDTGIFLDTRDVRARLRELAKAAGGRKSFLNLFAYTGTATCYAADGGCATTTTLDLSTRYLDVARRNLVRNGFHSFQPRDGSGGEGDSPAPKRERRPRPPHEFIRADALAWIAEQRQGKRRWDLIYCDPPTFSNSASMRKSFDVQRDHLDLLIGVSRLLARGGTALFCCNLSTFEPDLERLGRAGVALEDITKETIPFDFADGPLPHHCYLLTRTPRP